MTIYLLYYLKIDIFCVNLILYTVIILVTDAFYFKNAESVRKCRTILIKILFTIKDVWELSKIWKPFKIFTKSTLNKSKVIELNSYSRKIQLL